MKHSNLIYLTVLIVLGLFSNQNASTLIVNANEEADKADTQ